MLLLGMSGKLGEAVSFVTKIWLEPTSGPEPRWRGHIRHVQSGRDRYFEELEAMIRFIEETSGLRIPLGRRQRGKP
jgi:hypothetical protein